MSRNRYRARATEWPLAKGSLAFIGPLDFIGGTLTGAYSLRRMLSVYEGNCLRVRRSGDNAEQDFGFTASGLLDSSALTAWLGGDLGFVVVWYDQSGNGFNEMQATAANQPSLVLSSVTFDNKPTLDFDGSNDGFEYVAADRMHEATTSAFIVAVTSRDGANSGNRLASFGTQFGLDSQVGGTGAILSPGNNNGSAIGATGTSFGKSGGTAYVDTGPDNTAFVASGRMNGTSVWAGVNGIESSAALVSDALHPRYFAIGARALIPAAWFNGKLSEVVYFSAAPSDAERSALIAEAKGFWGIL